MRRPHPPPRRTPNPRRRLSPAKTLEEFSFDANPAINPAVIGRLAACGCRCKAGHPLCLIGDSGTGKGHLLIALGTLATEAGYRVRYTLTSKLVNELVEDRRLQAADEADQPLRPR